VVQRTDHFTARRAALHRIMKSSIGSSLIRPTKKPSLLPVRYSQTHANRSVPWTRTGFKSMSRRHVRSEGLTFRAGGGVSRGEGTFVYWCGNLLRPGFGDEHEIG
jgi:hypothetical protein